MQITVLSAVKTPAMSKANKPYTYLELAYKGEDGQVKGKKVMPFGESKVVFDILSNASQGETYDINTVKNDAGFWDWTAATKSNGEMPVAAQQTSTSVAKPGGKVLGSTYETPEERKVKQVYIVRQSSISAALGFLNNKAKSVSEVIQVAKEFESYVFSTGEVVAAPQEIE